MDDHRNNSKDCIERSNRLKTENIRLQHSPEELPYASQMSLRSGGHLEAAKVVKDITITSPKRALKYKTAYKQVSTQELPATEALLMFVDANLTRQQYNTIRKKDLSRFLCYKKIKLAKLSRNKAIAVTETSAKIKLRALLNHTASRIVQVQKDVQSRHTKNEEIVFD